MKKFGKRLLSVVLTAGMLLAAVPPAGALYEEYLPEITGFEWTGRGGDYLVIRLKEYSMPETHCLIVFSCECGGSSYYAPQMAFHFQPDMGQQAATEVISPLSISIGTSYADWAEKQYNYYIRQTMVDAIAISDSIAFVSDTDDW